jgi:hypothetical protein
MTKLGEVPEYRLPGDYGKRPTLAEAKRPNEVRQWRTARKQYRCDDASLWGHPGVIERGARYLEITVLSSDVYPTPARFRICEDCANSPTARS